jgi:hypothetical protein
MAKMASLKPANKVMASTVAVASTTLVIGLIEWLGKTNVPSAITISISTLLTFFAGYFFPPSTADQVVDS